MSSYNNDNKFMAGGKQLFAEEVVDLNNCDKEPIHIPGSIQPHGYLIAFSPEEEVLDISTNFEEISGKPAASHLGKFLPEVIGEDAAAIVDEKLTSFTHKKHFKLKVPQANGITVPFVGLLHRSKDVYILELEPESEKATSIDIDYVNESMQHMQEAASPAVLAAVVARKIKALTGFGRVMVYQFAEDDSGEVIAEEKEEGMDPFFGLRYPATDIPQQARKLYLLNPIRIIPNVAYTPVALESAGGKEISNTPLDLSFASLRSVSPIHIQYLKNMEVGASMSVSIIKNNRLWGLIACHHPTPHYLPYNYRQLSELLARGFAMVLGEKEEAIYRKYKQQVQEVKNSLFQRISKSDKFTDALHGEGPTAKDLIRSGGCVISFAEGYIPLGNTPPKEEVLALIDWLQKHIDEDVFFTHALPLIYPPAEKFRETGSGILAIAISHVQQEYIIWFRPELVQAVGWAGKQEEKVDAAGETHLSPRNSFEKWTEVVRNHAERWLGLEVEAAKDLRGLIVDVVLRISGELKLKADILSRLNNEMKSSKSEMDSFAYIASHDLKEPIRGIQTYAGFVLEDYGDKLDEDGKEKLKTMVRLSNHTQQLVDSLLQFSRMGRMELDLEDVNMEKVVEEATAVFMLRKAEEQFILEIEDGSWPVIHCDRLRITEVFINLISNALKYNDNAEKHLKVGFRLAVSGEEAPSGYVFYVQDNGIGIDAKFHNAVFTVFKRLNPRTAYGGGTGAGLTITKKIIERHGGKIWIKSQPGEGSVFFFTL